MTVKELPPALSQLPAVGNIPVSHNESDPVGIEADTPLLTDTPLTPRDWLKLVLAFVGSLAIAYGVFSQDAQDRALNKARRVERDKAYQVTVIPPLK
jgi:hypothetical protein